MNDSDSQPMHTLSKDVSDYTYRLIQRIEYDAVTDKDVGSIISQLNSVTERVIREPLYKQDSKYLILLEETIAWLDRRYGASNYKRVGRQVRR